VHPPRRVIWCSRAEARGGRGTHYASQWYNETRFSTCDARGTST
jgi:hypothetical protein